MFHEPCLVAGYATVVARMTRLDRLNVQNTHFLTRFCDCYPIVGIDIIPIEHPVDINWRITLDNRAAYCSGGEHVERLISEFEWHYQRDDWTKESREEMAN